MKVFRLFLFSTLFALSISSQASWDIYKSGLSINGGYYDCLLNTAAPDFQNNYFGRYSSGGSLVLNFSEMLTYKNGASNSCGGNLRYRVYRTCDTAPSFSSLALTFCCNNGGTDCGGGACGPDVNNPGDQKWKGIPGSTVNFISGLTLSGTYIIEVYYDATGDDSGGCTVTKFASNGGVNYRAYFEYEMNDNFTDLDFASPTWGLDAANFTVGANSTCSGLTGSEAYRTHTPKLNFTTAASGTESISTQIATWDTQQEWYFWIGRNGIGGSPSDLDANNQMAVYLYSDIANVEGAMNGYRILMGQTGTCFIKLQKMTAGVASTIFTSTVGVPTGLTDYGITFKVTRSQAGAWVIRTSTLPTNGATTQSTPTPNSCPEVLSTVNHGGVTDNTFVPAANGYFGFSAIHDATTEGRAAAEFDNFRFRALPPDTYLAINGSVTGTVAEDAVLAGNYAIGVDIFNPSGSSSTSVNIVLTSGSATRAGGGLTSATAYAPNYTTQTLTWTAGQTGTKYVYIDPANNALCDDIATLVFQLQSASGGTNAYVGSPNSLTLSVVDDDMGYETLLSENFNSGTLGSWVTTGTSWTANTTFPIEGTHSARHSTQASASQSSLTYPIDDANIVGINTTWRFEVSFANDATANNNFQIFLSSSENDLFSATNSGYAVVIDQSSLPSAGSLDYVRLYRVDNGVYASTPIVNSTTDWIDQVNSGTRVGFEVTLNDAGTWNLKVDADGNFDALSSLGTGVDLTGGAITYPVMKGFGVRFKYLAAASDLFRFDNISVSQSGCKELYYSRGTGASTGAVWSTAPSGAPSASAIVSGRWDRFVIQNGHNITATGSWLVNDITIETGATLTAGSSDLKVHGNWINEGTFTAGTSTVTFKGQAAQSIGFSVGSVATTFNNLTIDNDGFAVTASKAVNVTNVVSMLEGTLTTSPGGITLLSTSSASASIGEIKAGASVSGNVTLQRYTPSIPTVQGYWMNLGCPLSGQTIADWNDDITTTGFTGADYPSPYPFVNIVYYDETLSGTMNTGYVNATNVTNSLSTNQGYYVWLEGASQNIDNTGAIQSGTFTKSLSYTVTSPGGIFDYGWNLMANPYPSEVDWNLVSSTLSGPKVYYVFDYETNSYKFRNASTNSGSASRYIPHSQSFLVKVNAAGQSLAFQESYKTNTQAAFERSEDSENSFISMQLSRNGMSDESMLLFSDNATTSYDALDALDLESMNANSVEFSLMSADNITLAQDARPFNNDLTVPVRLDMPVAGTYVFSVNDAQNLPIGSCLYVEDLITGNTMSLLAGESMSITTDAPFAGVRLVIHGTAPVTTITSNATCNGIADGTLDITTPSGDWSVSLTGESDMYEYVSGGSITFDHLAAGTYMLEVNNNSGCGSSTSTIVIDEPQPVHTELVSSSFVTCNDGNNGAIELTVNNAEWFTYEIDNAQGELVRSGEVEGNHMIVEELSADLYTVHINASCSYEHFAVDLRDPNAGTLNVSVAPISVLTNGTSDVVLQAETSNPSEIHWTLSNGLSGDGDVFNAYINSVGEYTYTVTASGNCELTSTGTFTVAAPTGVQEIAKANLVTMLQQYNGVLLTFNQSISDKLFVSVYDAQGKELLNRRTTGIQGQNFFVDMETLSTGIYNIQVRTANTKVFSSQVFKR